MKIKISPLVYILVLYLFLIGRIVDFLSTLAVMLVHEYAHAVVAKRLGYKIGSIKIMPYGLVLSGFFESAPQKDECLIAVAGPLANLLTATALTALWWIFPSLYECSVTLVKASLSIFLVNLLPVYPLDGGRILLSLLAKKRGRALAHKRMKVVGVVFGVAFTLLFIVSCFYGLNISYATMGGFMLLSTLFPDESCVYEQALALSSRRRKLKKGLPHRKIMISGDAPITSLFKWLNQGYWTEFVILGEREQELMRFTEKELENISGGQMNEKVKILCKKR